VSVEANGQRQIEREGVIFLIFKDGRVLVEERKTPDKPYFGYKIIPGGKREQFDRSFYDAALREASEECGIKPTKMIYLDTFLHITASNHLYNTSAYLITSFEGEISNNEGKSDHHWLTFEEAYEKMPFVESRYVLRLAQQVLNGEGLRTD